MLGGTVWELRGEEGAEEVHDAASGGREVIEVEESIPEDSKEL